jgi:hypothetical protein
MKYIQLVVALSIMSSILIAGENGLGVVSLAGQQNKTMADLVHLSLGLTAYGCSPTG